MTRNLTRCALLCIVSLLALPALSVADWAEPVSGPSPINNQASRNVSAVSLATVGGVPHIAWNEDTTQPPAGSSSQIRVARLSADGTSWEKIGNSGSHPISRLSSTSSNDPDIADVGGVPWVVWSEGLTATNSEIRVARYNPGSNTWTRVVDTERPINHLRTSPGGQANYPTIEDGGAGRPYVSFFEADPGSGSLFFPGSEPAHVWVDRLSADGTSWQEVGGGPVSDPAFDAAFPRMDVIAGVPWVVHFQVRMVSGSPVLDLQVAHLSADGQSWVKIADPVTTAGPGEFENPDILGIGGRPHVAFSSTEGGSAKRVRVLRLDNAGTGWEPVGSGVANPTDSEPEGPSLAEIDGEPWVAWSNRGGASSQRITVARFTSGQWQVVGGDITSRPAQPAVRVLPSFASVNGFPWVAFGEDDGAAPPGPGTPPCCVQARVSRLEPEFEASTAQPESTEAALLGSVESFGLPFPVGFEYGLGGFTHSSAAAPVPAGGNFVTQIGGLQPSSLYTFRPYATAGIPLPHAVGEGELFFTESARAPAAGPLFLVAIVGHRQPVAFGQKVWVRFLVSRDSHAVLSIRRAGQEVGRVEKDVYAGRRAILWPGRAGGAPARPGRYKLVLVVSSGAEAVTDRSALRILPPATKRSR